jgi:hypothetical protein
MSFGETLTRFLVIGLLSAVGAAGCAASDTGGTKGRGGAGGASSTGTAGSTGGNTTGTGATGGTIGAGGSGITSSDAATGGLNCKNYQCFQNNCKLAGCKATACPNNGTTSVSGVVYDPAGINPLYNVIVYVPNAAVEPIPTGATCDACGKVSGEPVTSALTNAKGEFLLENVPVTDDIPIVIQVGKWRRQFTIPKPANCADTRLTDRNQTRMPRNKAEGHLPLMALTTGGADALECLLRKIGISESEMTPDNGAGRLHFYAGDGGAAKYNASLNNGAAFTPATTLWASANSLKKYDIVLLSCEGKATAEQMNKNPAALQAMHDYANVGGRVFASHWHNYWLEKGPGQFPTVALFEHHVDLPNPFTAAIDTTFPKGMALAEWLVHVGSMAPFGQLIITEGKHTVNRATEMTSQRWVYSASPVSTQYFSFNTPIGTPEEMQCGRVVFSDIHVSAMDTSMGTAYPDGCRTTTMTDQEKALEFMLFDLSACVIKDNKPPMPPK